MAPAVAVITRSTLLFALVLIFFLSRAVLGGLWARFVRGRLREIAACGLAGSSLCFTVRRPGPLSASSRIGSRGLAEKSFLSIARPLPDTHRVAGEEMGRLAPALPE
jgi:hypothetical protein